MIEHPNLKFLDMTDKHKGGKISSADLDRECAYWFLDCFEEINPRTEPTPPLKYVEFKRMPIEKQFKVQDEILLQPEIRNYLDMKDQVKNWNNSKVLQLKEFKSYLPEEDFISRKRYEEKLNDFIAPSVVW